MTTQEVIDTATDQMGVSEDELFAAIADSFQAPEHMFFEGYQTPMKTYVIQFQEQFGEDQSDAEYAAHVVEMVKRFGDEAAHERACDAYSALYD